MANRRLVLVPVSQWTVSVILPASRRSDESGRVVSENFADPILRVKSWCLLGRTCTDEIWPRGEGGGV